jgi:hypothetical protein
VRPRPRLTALVLLLAGLTTALGIAFASYGKDSRSRAFERAAWLEPVGYCTKSERGRMVDDLVAYRLHAGMPVRRIRSLLGRPDEASDDGTWVYHVSAEYNGFLPACVSLSVYITKGRLESAEVMQDD